MLKQYQTFKEPHWVREGTNQIQMKFIQKNKIKTHCVMSKFRVCRACKSRVAYTALGAAAPRSHLGGLDAGSEFGANARVPWVGFFEAGKLRGNHR